MVPTAPSFRLFLFAFCLLIFDFCCAHPSPYSNTSTVSPRQVTETNLTSPVTVKHSERITTGVGTFLRTCTITLTPTVVNGVDMVREEKTCVVTADNGNGDTPGALPPPGSSTDIPSPTVPPNPTVTGTPPVVVIGISSVPKPAATPPPGIPDSSTPSPSVPKPDVNPQPGNPDLSTTTTTTPPPPPTSTPVSENVGAAPSDPPGKKLEVLPIGLGVFAGVSVVALFVVGIVTYERTKHRRNFRKLKLEEAGSRMGYGTV